MNMLMGAMLSWLHEGSVNIGTDAAMHNPLKVIVLSKPVLAIRHEAKSLKQVDCAQEKRLG